MSLPYDPSGTNNTIPGTNTKLPPGITPGQTIGPPNANTNWQVPQNNNTSGSGFNIVNAINNIIKNFTNHLPANATTPNPINTNGLDFNTNGPAKPDHFFDVNPLDQAKFDADQSQVKWQNDFDMAKFNWDKSVQDKQLAISQGNLDLAIQAQKDENYWKGQTLAAQERMNAASNAASVQGHQIDAAAQIQSASINAAAARYAADLRFQSDMANATNDAERNRIALAHEQEYAAIAKMEDDTKRAIAAQENNIKAFDAESTRAYQMGDLAIKNNQFLLDASSRPRDLFGLYFMQRGMTPDWNTVLSGGTPAQGDPLAPVNPMKAYVPKITMPTDFTLNPGPSYGTVGNAAVGVKIGNNPYISSPGAQQQQQIVQSTQQQTGTNNADFGNGGKGAGLIPIRFAEGSGYTNARQFMAGDAPSPNPWDGGAMPEVIDNPTGAPIAVRNSAQTAADFGAQKPTGQIDEMQIKNLIEQIRMQNLARMMQSISSGPAGVGPTPQMPTQQQTPMPMPQQSAVNQQLGPAAKAMDTDMTNPILAQVSSLMRSQMPRFAQGTGPLPVPVGGYPTEAGTGGGSLPLNGIPAGFNPATGSPISIGTGTLGNPVSGTMPTGGNPSSATATPNWYPDFGFAGGKGAGTGLNQVGSWTNTSWNSPTGTRGFYSPPPEEEIPLPTPSSVFKKADYPVAPTSGAAQYFTPPIDTIVNPGDDPIKLPNEKPNPIPVNGPSGVMISMDPTNSGPPIMNDSNTNNNGIPQAYVDAGLGQLWLQNSQNQYLEGQPLPPAIAALVKYGVPISPALYNSVAGNILPSLNGGAAFTGRGGGVLPSLRTINDMTPGEQDLFGNGYTQGVLGLDWKDIADFISRPTANLNQARMSQGLW